MKIIIITLCGTALLFAFGALVPIKRYQRSGCFVQTYKRLDIIQGESIKTLDDKQASHRSAPNAGMCDPTPQTVKLYLI